jgi:hypothetical protein
VSGDWPVVRLDEVAEVRLGRQRSPKNHDGDNMLPYLRAANVTAQGLSMADVKVMHFSPAEAKTFALEPGDILVSEASGSPMEVGKSGVWRGEIDGDVCFQNTLLRVRAQGEVLPDYLRLVIENARRCGVFARRSRGVGMNHLTSKGLAGMEVALPGLALQQAAVARAQQLQGQLDFLSAPVEGLSARLAALQQSYKRTLLDGTVRLATQENSAWPESAEEDDVRQRLRLRRRVPSQGRPPQVELPDGWRWVRWPDVGLVQNGVAFPSSDYSDQGVRLLRPGNLHKSGRVAWTPANTRHLPPRYADSAQQHLVGPGELVMNLTAQSLRDAFLGRICMTPTGDAHVPCLLNQRIARLLPLDAVLPRFAFHVFKSPAFRAYVDSLNSGSLIQHMHTKQLDDFYFPLPPKGEQMAIADALDDFDAQVERLDLGLSKVRALLARLDRSVLQAVVGTPRSAA